MVAIDDQDTAIYLKLCLNVATVSQPAKVGNRYLASYVNAVLVNHSLYFISELWVRVDLT